MISDFIKVFKDTYKKYNKKKLDAKLCLEVFKDEIKIQKEHAIKIQKLSSSLRDCCTIVPNKIFIDYYAKTMNYLNYGEGVTYYEDGSVGIPGNPLGFVKFMNALYKFMEVEYDIAKGFYKDKNYDACIERIKKAIETFNKKWKEMDKEYTEISQVQTD